MKRFLIGVILALIGGLLFVSLVSAKASAAANVTLSDFKVELSTDNLPAGTAIAFAITNNGPSLHELVLEKAGVADEPLEFNGTAQEAEDIEAGTTRAVEWTIPEAGQYQLACHVPGHYEAGMKTTFTVTAGSAPGTLPKTGGAENWWPLALGLLALVTLGGGLALRSRKA
jgi:LPXTG-motif cell wall-anchored protein